MKLSLIYITVNLVQYASYLKHHFKSFLSVARLISPADYNGEYKYLDSQAF